MERNTHNVIKCIILLTTINTFSIIITTFTSEIVKCIKIIVDSLSKVSVFDSLYSRSCIKWSIVLPKKFNCDNKTETNPNKLQFTAEKLHQYDQRMHLSLGDRFRIVKMIILQLI